jgi:hypothetical protein
MAMVFCTSLGAVTAFGPALNPAAAQAPPRPAGTPAPVAATPGNERLTQAQLEQLLAPIALYPDTLLTQMLMASTYPLEIVQAKRWRDRNGSLAGAALEQALLDQPWDASVKSLVPFPDVLTLMNDQLEWTQQVGDAMLAQQQDVLNAVQVLRGRAQANGALQTGPQQTVTVTQNVAAAPAAGAAAPAVAPPAQVITIAPTQPDTVYLPAYDPNQVYGTWPYPQSPPYSYPPPVGWGLGGALLTGMAFAGGAAIVGGLWGWGGANWGSGDINVNADRVNNINRNVNRTGATVGSGNRWQHDTTHRQGVAYRGDEVRNRYQGDRRQQAAAREQFRGRTQQPGGAFTGGDRPGGGQVQRPGGADRPGAGARPGAGDRPGAGARPGGAERPGAGARPGGADRPAAGARPGAGDRGGPGAAQRPAGGNRVAASGRPQVSQQPSGGQRGGGAQGFQGMGDGGRERAAAQRGASSRQGAGYSAGGGGRGGGAAAARGGGGGAAAARGGGGGAAAARGGGGGGGRGGGGGGRGGRR